MDDFVTRLLQIMEYYNLNASAFAEKIGVQPSGVSHILSQRNKPSLDFIIKLVDKFPEVDMDWFVFGKGHFPKDEENDHKKKPPLLTEGSNSTTSNVLGIEINKLKTPVFTENKQREIKKIVFFYTDQSFEIFENDTF